MTFFPLKSVAINDHRTLSFIGRGLIDVCVCGFVLAGDDDGEFVSRAVVTELTLDRRREAAARMRELRAALQPLPGSTEEWIREDRGSHD